MGIKPTKRRPFVVPGIVLAAVVLLWLVFHRTPGEKTLVARFENHRAEFNELKAMISTNLPGEILRYDGPAWSLEHYKRYRRLLRETGVIRTMQTTNEFSFVMVEPAPKKRGARLAITWLDAKPERVLTRLEDFRKTGGQVEQAYRLLEDHWYLWIQE